MCCFQATCWLTSWSPVWYKCRHCGTVLRIFEKLRFRESDINLNPIAHNNRQELITCRFCFNAFFTAKTAPTAIFPVHEVPKINRTRKYT
ncbi:anti-sigma-F factor Fin [Nonlabens sp. Hel1_33_55]|uniref:anti-sigma-F factor Fin n=1 Tax=Nonlabens sp. Hel1_33_55 TaxID=1336802 RepID=UPI00156100DA